MFSKYSHLTRLVGLVAVVMSLAVGTATAASTAGGTALRLNEDGLRGLNADGLRLQGMADRYQWLQGLKADGLRLQAAARSYENRPAASYYTPEALKAQALRWQGIAATYKPVVTSTSGSSFDWRDAGIGAGVGVVALLGFTLLVVAGRRVRGEKLAV
jgi:hypothetical protein